MYNQAVYIHTMNEQLTIHRIKVSAPLIDYTVCIQVSILKLHQ